jgi:hypothetical protein
MRAAPAFPVASSRLKWVAGFLPFALLSATATDWPQYRGPGHNGVSTDRLNRQWTGSVTNPVWIVSVTNALSSMAVSGGRVLTQVRRNIAGADKEVCVALNATNGAELWSVVVDDNATYDGGVGYDDGPRTTPSVDGGSVYVLSSYLNLFRLNVTNGAVIWQKDLRAIYGGDVIGWQNCASPLVDNGLLFVNANCGTNTLLALRTSDGNPAWRSQDEAMTHSTPILATIHGVRQLIWATQSGLVSLDPASGNFLWRFNYPFTYFISLGCSPVVWDDMVFICGAYDYSEGSVVMQANLTNNTWTTTQLWFAYDPSAHWMTPIAWQGYLYGQFGIQTYDTPHAQLTCVNMRTGIANWAVPEFGRGATVLADNHLLVITELGDLVLADASPLGYNELGRFQAIPYYDQDTNKCWNGVAICDGKVYVRSTSYGACYDLSVPDLKLDLPPRVSTNRFQLTIRAADGSAVNSNRLAGMQLLASTNMALSISTWPSLTNALLLSNGIIRVNNVDSGNSPRRFFIVSEPK